MPFTYKPLFKMMIDRGIKKGDLRDFLSASTVAKMGKDEYVALEVLDKICTHLDCKIEDIIEHVPDKSE
ncbi:helix-turn-helix domain-containing protein [Brevibacillus laterosporus]|uniref:helix-turn-helix domain-containing protein n=1 Tax=Brevibacillus laterosporus TaxID=1465 RepID=UPI002654BBCB|nr:helix-turn-helix domain-containing protein [Brevibacillus laterosporus]MDN9011062.1 helix-turn-helix domain-containing protein [Brevibacillus laterosporus]MDO0942085.1 helix-turn-helix domain-containing protein [Brevibacillus laterosporus]